MEVRRALGVFIILAIVYVVALISSGWRPLEALKFSGMMVGGFLAIGLLVGLLMLAIALIEGTDL